ncbi:glycine cleavage system aminomethyltransferase GcvT [Azohydromonas caseinilytica]|uniref:aminomethyltransferase n=1 Tax=Azohydromonas caseinilytica TaxID=2728836 RepID=A0A848F759_9BURK|nr:glycine cleavage system aminomethyltransferase GcvT [Azohydromonas caseinilytica]NML14576.1 glycine cleavage system aminomethyltransferase GcvT [Azohydromonas caseinilytica]
MTAPTATSDTVPPVLQRTPLHALHLELGARMVPFAGYEMPVSYPAGILAEHRHCREAAALFDVSHMGQVRLEGAEAAQALESLVPVDIADLPIGRQRYGFFTNTAGGILDDLMVTRRPQDLFMVINASRKDHDLQLLRTQIGHRCHVVSMPERALLALQGPLAVQALARLDAGVAALTFMGTGSFSLNGAECFVSRSGYTGEDGFEISVPAEAAASLAKALLAQPEVKPAGLGARDTLRLEAGLCLYGHDIDESTTPVEAGLTWAIQKVRRPGGARAGGYPGSQAIEAQLANGAPRKRVGLLGLERAPVREGAPVLDARGQRVGQVTSGTLSPQLGKPIAMAYVDAAHAVPGADLSAEVRLKPQPMRVVAMPFAPHRYHRG